MVIILFSSLSMKQKYRFGTTEIFFIVNYFWAQQKQDKLGQALVMDLFGTAS